MDTQHRIRIFITELHRIVPNFKLPKYPTANRYVNDNMFTYLNVIQQEKNLKLQLSTSIWINFIT